MNIIQIYLLQRKKIEAYYCERSTYFSTSQENISEP